MRVITSDTRFVVFVGFWVFSSTIAMSFPLIVWLWMLYHLSY